MQYQIKRKTSGADLIVATLTPTGSQQREAMGVDIVDMAFALPNFVEFKLGDFVEVYNQTYKLNTLPTVQKISSNNYSYSLQFEAVFYDLAKVQMQMLNPQNQLLEPVFDLTGNAATVVGLIVDNALRYSAGWTVGVVDVTEYETFSFSANNCLQALHDLASRFKTEFWIDNKTIHLQKREQSSGLTFEYGKGNGLYTVTRKAKDNAKLLTRLYVRGGSTNIPAGYGSSSLLLPNGATYIQDDAKANPALGGELIEATQVFADIFPTRTGTVSAVVASGGIGAPADNNWKYFYDDALDFNINDHLAAGLDAKVYFVSGNLAGYTFTVSNYDHATKRFTINKNEDETAIDIPSDSLRPRVGDKYRLIDIVMPDAYVTTAENNLLAAAQTYYDENSNTANLYEYSATVDRMFVKANAINVVLGNTAILQDADMNFSSELRISKYTRNLQDSYDYSEVIWSDKITANEIVRQYQQQQKTLLLLESSGLLSVDQMRKNIFLNRLSANNGYLLLGGEKVKAGIADYAPQAGHALTANEAVNADLWDAKQFDDYLNQAVKTNSNVVFKSLRSPNFNSGALGSGFRIDENGNAEVDNLIVRKSLQTTEFVLQKIRASNGAIAVTDAIQIKNVSLDDNGDYWCTVDQENNPTIMPFVYNDLLRCQVWSGTAVKQYTVRVIYANAYGFTLQSSSKVGDGVPAAGDTVVRFGNIGDTNRQGLIYITAADSGAPYMDVLDGVNSANLSGKTKVRLGKLDGIVDADLGALSGYGIYAQNGFFKGKVHITGGNAQTIAGSQALASAAQSAAIASAAADATAKANAAQASAQAMVDAVKIGGRNLIVGSKINATVNNGVGNFLFFNSLSNRLVVGETYVFTSKRLSGNYSELVLSYDVNDYTDRQQIFENIPFVAQFNSKAIRSYHYPEYPDLSVEWIKLEKGNKATDWTPAPEDVDAAVSVAQTTANAAQAANAALTTSLKAMAFKDVVQLAELGNTIIEGGKIKTNLLDADYIKANIVNAAYINALEIDASAIKSGTIDSARINAAQIVSNGGGATQAYVNNSSAIAQANAIATAATDAQVKADAAQAAGQQLVNNLKFGGRNYVVGSDVYSTAPYYFFSFSEVQNWRGKTITVSVDIEIVNATGTRIGFEPAIFFEDGSTLYASAWYWITQGESIKQRITGTYNIPDKPIAGLSQNGMYIQCQGDVAKVGRPKLEIGNKATDWTPAPEDLNQAVNAAQATANAAQAANSALTASLKAMAFKDVVQLAELGNTIIEGGKIKTVLLDAAAIKANIVNADYINSLEIVARNLAATSGNIGGWQIDAAGIKDTTGLGKIHSLVDNGANGKTEVKIGAYSTLQGVETITAVNNYAVQIELTQKKTNGKFWANTALRVSARGGDLNYAIDCDGNLLTRGTITSLKALFLNNIAAITGGGLSNGIVSYFTDGAGRKVLVLGSNTDHVSDDEGLFWNSAQTAYVQYGPCGTYDPYSGQWEVGTEHQFTVAAHTYSSTTSKADANNQAYQAAYNAAQEEANNYGYCYVP